MKSNTILKQLPIEYLTRSKFQPRVVFTEEAINELAHSIRANGILQPIIVRPTSNYNLYEIIAGERRWRAAQKAGLTKIDCLINQYTDKQAAAAAAIENLNRADLNPIEEAQAYKKLIENFNYSHEEVAATMGKSRTKITNSLRLLSLDNNVMSLIIKGKLSESHGKVIAGLDKNLQTDYANKCITNELSVRELEKSIKKSKTATVKLDKQNTTQLEINSLAEQLSEHLGCTTTIKYHNNKGVIKIYFQNLEVFDGILEKLNFNNNM